MTIYALDAAINSIRFGLHEYRRTSGTVVNNEKYQSLMDKLNYLIIEYGQVLGDFKARFPEKMMNMQENSKTAEKIFEEISKAANPNEKINTLPRVLICCAELASFGKTLEAEQKEIQSKNFEFDKRLNSLQDDLSKLRKIVDTLSKKINR